MKVILNREDLEEYRDYSSRPYGFRVYKLPIRINNRRYLIEKIHEWESSFALAENLDGGAEHQYYTCGLWLDYGSSYGDIDLLSQVHKFKFT